MDKDTYEAQREQMTSEGGTTHPSFAIDRTERLERLVQQAEVAMDKLTNSPEWDAFVQIVQSRLEAAKDDYEHMAYELAHPSYECGIAPITRQRLALAGLHATIGSMEWIVGLPREIMDAAEAAGMEGEEGKT